MVLINAVFAPVMVTDMGGNVNAMPKKLTQPRTNYNVIDTQTTPKYALDEECVDAAFANVSRNQWKREYMVNSVSVTTSVAIVLMERFAVVLSVVNAIVGCANATRNGRDQLANVSRALSHAWIQPQEKCVQVVENVCAGCAGVTKQKRVNILECTVKSVPHVQPNVKRSRSVFNVKYLVLVPWMKKSAAIVLISLLIRINSKCHLKPEKSFAYLLTTMIASFNSNTSTMRIKIS